MDKKPNLRTNKYFFYHSFPRPEENQHKNIMIKKGLRILESIVNNGLLLTPESIEWEEPLENGTLGNKMISIAKSCSFTEIPLNKLKAHSAKFGYFSIEFDIEVLRKLGAIPVFYLPKAPDGDDSLESLASSLMIRMGEITEFLNNLGKLEKWAEENLEKKNFFPILDSCGQQRIGRFNSEAIKDIIEFCRGYSQPLKILINALRYIHGFHYPAENYRYNNRMDYYKQREWRIVANMSFHGKELTYPIKDEGIKKMLISIDPNFYQKEIALHYNRTARIIDLCQLFPEYNNKNFIEYAKRVIVPSKAVDLATSILNKCANPPEVVDFKSIFPGEG